MKKKPHKPPQPPPAGPYDRAVVGAVLALKEARRACLALQAAAEQSPDELSGEASADATGAAWAVDVAALHIEGYLRSDLLPLLKLKRK